MNFNYTRLSWQNREYDSWTGSKIKSYVVIKGNI